MQAEEKDPELIDATATPTAANSADTTPTSWVVGPCGLSSAGLDFLFHMFFLARYCRLLEEGSFRGRTADFLYMLVFGEPPPPAPPPAALVHAHATVPMGCGRMRP